MTRGIAGLVVLLILGCEGGGLTNPRVTPDPATGSQSTVTTAATGEDAVVELRLDDSVAAGALRLRWLELKDSRCPRGVQCVWEGEAVVTLEVVRGDEARQTVELTLRPGTEAAASAVAGHELRLLEVRPYPRQEVTPERNEFRAVVDVGLQGGERRPAGDRSLEKDGTLKLSRELLALAEELEAWVGRSSGEEFRPSSSVLQVKAGRVAIECTPEGEAERLVADLEQLDATGIASFGGRVSGWLPIQAVPQLAELDSLRFARAAMAMTH